MHLSPILVTSAMFSPLVLGLPIPSPRPADEPCDNNSSPVANLLSIGAGLGLGILNGGHSSNGISTPLGGGGIGANLYVLHFPP